MHGGLGIRHYYMKTTFEECTTNQFIGRPVAAPGCRWLVTWFLTILQQTWELSTDNQPTHGQNEETENIRMD